MKITEIELGIIVKKLSQVAKDAAQVIKIITSIV